MSELRVTTLKHESATVNNITLAANGNVGIGINAPTGRLQVIGAAGSELLIGYAGASTNYIDADTQIFRNGSKAELMRIDSAGRVTTPYQPAASASYGGGDIGATNLIPLNNNPITRGGIAIGTNAFTVPVAGTYFVGYHHLATNNNVQVAIRVNGTSINGGGGSLTQAHASAVHNNFSSQNLVALAANDSISFVVTSQLVHGNPSYNRMYIYLIG